MKEIQDFEQVKRYYWTPEEMQEDSTGSYVGAPDYDALLAYTKELHKQLESRYAEGYAKGYHEGREDGENGGTRTVKTQELIEAAEEAINRNGQYFYSEVRSRLVTAAAAARAYEGGWINCKEKLPPTETEVLVVYIDNDEQIQTEARIIRDHWFAETGNNYIFNVTHWRQKLPSPPLSVETPNEVQK